MRAADFFVEEHVPTSDVSGSDPWGSAHWPMTRKVFNIALVQRFRLGSLDGVREVDAAYGLVQLAHEQLLLCGTSGGQALDDAEMVAVVRSLRAVLGRLKIPFDPPFRDFKGFHGYWSKEGMGGSWAARRGYLSDLFTPILSQIERIDEAETLGSAIRGVDGQLKNIIFASKGPKPRIVLRDALSNVVEVVQNSEHCLFYDRPLEAAGLTWAELVDWWGVQPLSAGPDEVGLAKNLYMRLRMSLASAPEKVLFRAYCQRYAGADGAKQPALLPQVYLHYDPYTRRQLGVDGIVLKRERMDFLMLLPNGVRVVIEVDGKQHYAEGDVPSPPLYAEMVREDRALRLRGYEVYRFGGHELPVNGSANGMLDKFCSALLERHGVG